MPPSVLTPRATPMTSIGTLTVIFTSIRTRTKSMWRGLRERGSRCSSLIIAWRLWSEPASFSRKIAFSPAPSRNRSDSALRFTAIGTFGLPAPYTTAGICPAMRVRRASFFPVVERFSTFNSIVFMTYPARESAQRGGFYTKSEETEAPSWIRWMASPRRGATERAWIRGQRAMAASTGMVLVTSRLFRPEPSIRSSAGPEKTPWTAAA